MPVDGVELNLLMRSPQSGQVKSRLAADVGTARALAVHRELALKTIQTMQASDLPHTIWLHGQRHWQGTTGRSRGQPPGDLGDKMAEILRRSLADQDAAIVIGSDCPSLTPELLQEAASALRGSCPLVLGPALDGGYYLLGVRRRFPWLFSHMRWGTSAVMAETLRRAKRHDVKPYLLPMLDDIDTLGDLKRYQQNNRGVRCL